MRRIILTTAAVLILGTTGAFAGGVNYAFIGQAGFNNVAGVDQTLTQHSSVQVSQVGYQNGTAVIQNGNSASANNVAIVGQYGLRNSSSILQLGAGNNGAEVVQYGAFNQAAVVQNNNSTAIVSQVGLANKALILQ